MFQRLIDDFKDSTGTALRLTSLAAAAAMALLVTTGFLCAAAFVLVLEKYGPVQACLTGAAIFFVVTLIAAGSYMVRKRQIESARRTSGQDREIHRADRAGRPDAGRGRHPGDPRHRRQEADPDPRGRRTRAGISGQPRQHERQRRRSAGGVASGVTREGGVSSTLRARCPRHCEAISGPRTMRRSEAIPITCRCAWMTGFRFALPIAMTTGYEFAISRRIAPEVCQLLPSSKSEGAGKTGCLLHPRSRVRFAQTKCTRAYRAAGTLRPSLRNGFTAYFVLFPENGSFASVIPKKLRFSRT